MGREGIRRARRLSLREPPESLENHMKHTKPIAWLRRLWIRTRAAHARQSEEWTRRMEAPSR